MQKSVREPIPDLIFVYSEKNGLCDCLLWPKNTQLYRKR